METTRIRNEATPTRLFQLRAEGYQCVRVQAWQGTSVAGNKLGRVQAWLGTSLAGYKRGWEQAWQGTSVAGNKLGRVQVQAW
jgi:hypothetical protein